MYVCMLKLVKVSSAERVKWSYEINWLINWPISISTPHHTKHFNVYIYVCLHTRCIVRGAPCHEIDSNSFKTAQTRKMLFYVILRFLRPHRKINSTLTHTWWFLLCVCVCVICIYSSHRSIVHHEISSSSQMKLST